MVWGGQNGALGSILGSRRHRESKIIKESSRMPKVIESLIPTTECEDLILW